MSFLSYIKDFFVLMLLLFLMAYLLPKEEYKKYFQLFAGTLLAVALLGPVLGWWNTWDEQRMLAEWKTITERMHSIEYNLEGEDIFELFILEEYTEENE